MLLTKEQLELMQPKLIYVTPAVAQEWLNNNYSKNRKVRESVVDKYVNDMASGKWKEAMPDSVICISPAETLLNGQHRLGAIVKSMTSHWFWVSKNVPIEYYYEMDNGSARKTADFIDGKSATIIAALSSRVTKLKSGTKASSVVSSAGGMGTRITRSTILENANTDALIPKCVDIGVAMRNKLRCGTPTDYSMFAYLVKSSNNDDFLDEFITEFKSDVTYAQPVGYIKQKLTARYLNKKRGEVISSEWIIGVLLQSYEAYRAGTDLNCCNQSKAFVERYCKEAYETLCGIGENND